MTYQHIYEKDLLRIINEPRPEEEGLSVLERILRVDKLCCLEMQIEANLNPSVDAEWFYTLCIMFCELYRYANLPLEEFDYLEELYIQHVKALACTENKVEPKEKLSELKRYIILRKELVKFLSAKVS